MGKDYRKEAPYDRYIDRYIIIDIPGHRLTQAGKLVDIIDGIGILNPFQGGEWISKDTFERKMIKDDSTADLRVLGINIEPTTLKSLKNYCIYSNKKGEKEKKEESKNQNTR